MKIVVIGATGGVGRRLVELALEEEHEVTAAVRNPADLAEPHPRLRVVACDVYDAQAVERVVAGCDVVFVAVGTKDRGRTSLYSTAAYNVGRAARRQGAKRVIFLSNFGVSGETSRDPLTGLLLFLVKRFLRNTLEDHRRAIEELRASGVDWLAVRPLPLTDGEWTGRYRVLVEGVPDRARAISRADVADFMLKQATSHEYRNVAPSIAY